MGKKMAPVRSSKKKDVEVTVTRKGHSEDLIPRPLTRVALLVGPSGMPVLHQYVRTEIGMFTCAHGQPPQPCHKFIFADDIGNERVWGCV
jgi:hypothetical protein